MRDIEAEQANVERALADEKLNRLEPALEAMFGDHKQQKLHQRVRQEARRLADEADEKEEGMGKPVERRGMSSLKNDYGYHDITLGKGGKSMEFDDSKNDNYYKKPVM
jgi:hypothetical protein